MINYEIFCKIKDLDANKHLKPPQIASVLGLDVETVRKWLSEPHFRKRTSTQRVSILDPFKSDIVALLESYPYSAVQIFQNISEQGFPGKYGAVKEFVQKVRPRRSPAFLKLSFAPGDCAQVDWGAYGSVAVGETRRRLSFFVMVLCWSRLMYVEFTVSQTMEHFLACHQNAFEFFGGVPKKIMVDNLKSAVLKRVLGEAPVLNPKYLDFSKHYGFKIAPCNVGKGNEKGRVENGVGYVKKNFLAGLELPDFCALNPAAKAWLETIANARIHGETKEKPAVRFVEEKKCLLPLPINDFDIGTISQARASSQFRIAVDANRYSVPAEFAGTRLNLKTYPDRLCVYSGGNLIARHPRSYDRNKDFEDPDHPKELLKQRRKANDQKIFGRLIALTPLAHAYYLKLEEKRLNPTHHVRKIVALSEIYPPEEVARAVRDAFHFEAFSSQYVENLLEQRSRIAVEPGALHLTRRKDLLEIKIQEPNLGIYQKSIENKEKESER